MVQVVDQDWLLIFLLATRFAGEREESDRTADQQHEHRVLDEQNLQLGHNGELEREQDDDERGERKAKHVVLVEFGKVNALQTEHQLEDEPHDDEQFDGGLVQNERAVEREQRQHGGQ